MKLPQIMIGLASGALLSACASSASMPPTALTRPAPLECLQVCPLPPTLALHRQAWEAAMLSWGAACKRLHDDCVKELAR